MHRGIAVGTLACVVACLLSLQVKAQGHGPSGNVCEIASKDITPAMSADLLDPEAPNAARDKALAAYMALPTDGGCEFNYRIGSLYRFGPDLPGNLLPKDTQKARGLILAYAEDGNLMAYADLAEMALKEGNAREAMKWTQVYLALRSSTDNDFRTGDEVYHRSGYNGDLLLRVQKAWNRQRPHLPQDLIQSDLSDYLAQHKRAFLERAAQAEGGRDEGTLKGARVREECEVDMHGIPGAYARYLVEVQPSGRVSRVLVEDFTPGIEAANRLAKCVKLYEFSPFEGTTAKVGLMPVTYGYSDGSRISK